MGEVLMNWTKSKSRIFRFCFTLASLACLACFVAAEPPLLPCGLLFEVWADSDTNKLFWHATLTHGCFRRTPAIHIWLAEPLGEDQSWLSSISFLTLFGCPELLKMLRRMFNPRIAMKGTTHVHQSLGDRNVRGYFCQE